jgi:RHS repeat-associated protein
MGSLIAVSLPDGRLIEYVTDGQGRRIAKKVNSVVTKRWLWSDSLRVAGEIDSGGNLAAQYIYATDLNIPKLVLIGGNTYRVVTNQLGSPALVVNVANSADILLSAQFDAWGNRTLIGGAEDAIPFGFAGGFYDPDTKLTRFGARDYDPTIGRWVSKDLIRFDGGNGNLYLYSNGDPINDYDYDGNNAGVLAAGAIGLGEAALGALAGALACFLMTGDEPKKCPPCPAPPPPEFHYDHPHYPCGPHWHYFVYNQNPVTCTCYLSREFGGCL